LNPDVHPAGMMNVWACCLTQGLALQLQQCLVPDRPSTFNILQLDLSNFLQRFGNTPLADEYCAALIDYLHASTVLPPFFLSTAVLAA